MWNSMKICAMVFCRFLINLVAFPQLHNGVDDDDDDARIPKHEQIREIQNQRTIVGISVNSLINNID